MLIIAKVHVLVAGVSEKLQVLLAMTAGFIRYLVYGIIIFYTKFVFLVDHAHAFSLYKLR